METTIEPRFKVATVTGYSITQPPTARNRHTPEGVTAHVLDTYYCHRVVRSYHSEHINSRPPYPKGHGRTIALAEAECDRLNRRHG